MTDSKKPLQEIRSKLGIDNEAEVPLLDAVLYFQEAKRLPCLKFAQGCGDISNPTHFANVLKELCSYPEVPAGCAIVFNNHVTSFHRFPTNSHRRTYPYRWLDTAHGNEGTCFVRFVSVEALAAFATSYYLSQINQGHCSKPWAPYAKIDEEGIEAYDAHTFQYFIFYGGDDLIVDENGASSSPTDHLANDADVSPHKKSDSGEALMPTKGTKIADVNGASTSTVSLGKTIPAGLPSQPQHRVQGAFGRWRGFGQEWSTMSQSNTSNPSTVDDNFFLLAPWPPNFPEHYNPRKHLLVALKGSMSSAVFESKTSLKAREEDYEIAIARKKTAKAHGSKESSKMTTGLVAAGTLHVNAGTDNTGKAATESEADDCGDAGLYDKVTEVKATELLDEDFEVVAGDTLVDDSAETHKEAKSTSNPFVIGTTSQTSEFGLGMEFASRPFSFGSTVPESSNTNPSTTLTSRDNDSKAPQLQNPAFNRQMDVTAGVTCTIGRHLETMPMLQHRCKLLRSLRQLPPHRMTVPFRAPMVSQLRPKRWEQKQRSVSRWIWVSM
jgi:hypothetical protein